jgi:hypothetical protein
MMPVESGLENGLQNELDRRLQPTNYRNRKYADFYLMSFVIPVIGLGPVRYLFEESIRAESFLKLPYHLTGASERKNECSFCQKPTIRSILRLDSSMV